MADPSEASANLPAGSVGAPDAVARLVELEQGLYAFSISDRSPWLGADAGFAMPAVHISALPRRQDRTIEITDASGSTARWR